MIKILTAFATIALLFLLLQLVNAVRRKPRTTQERAAEISPAASDEKSAAPAPQPADADQPRPMCGLGGICNLECAVEELVQEPDYYDDEELDAFRGTASDAYSPAQVEQFEEVLTTMRPEEVHGWLRSLQLRGVELPDALKDEAYMIVSEQAAEA